MTMATRPIDVQRRLVELGRIRLGEKGEKGEPRKRTTFRVTSASRSHLEAVARVYGGTVRPWQGAPDEGMFEVATESAELDILIPPTLAAYSQAYELWAGGAATRRCDGVTESLSGQPCICAAQGLHGADRKPPAGCDLTTRVSVMLPKVPGLGVWRVDTKGWNAATTLPATLELLGAMARGGWVPAVLRMEQRSRKVRADGKVLTRRFVVPVVDIPEATIGQMMMEGTALPALPERGRVPRPELPAGPPPPAETGFSMQPEGRMTASTRPARPAPAAVVDQPSPTRGAAATEPSRRVDSDGVIHEDPFDLASEPLPFAPDEVPMRCSGQEKALGQCVRPTGHDGLHRNATNETWR